MGLLSSLKVSIPLEQGSVLRQVKEKPLTYSQRLNPFGTGQCLTTVDRLCATADTVSIPLEQGSVLRQRYPI